jgi:hypothetical protein
VSTVSSCGYSTIITSCRIQNFQLRNGGQSPISKMQPIWVSFPSGTASGVISCLGDPYISKIPASQSPRLRPACTTKPPTGWRQHLYSTSIGHSKLAAKLVEFFLMGTELRVLFTYIFSLVLVFLEPKRAILEPEFDSRWH